MAEIILAAVFAMSAALIFYVYFGYPLLLWILTRGGGTAPKRGSEADHRLPKAVILTAACNEEVVIREKVENCLSLEYPPGQLDFIFVTDGCTDRTVEILNEYRDNPRVKVRVGRERQGKLAAMSTVLPWTENYEVLVFTDANAFFRPEAALKLMRHFGDPQVGVSTGDVRLVSAGASFSEGEGLYYKYERKLQEWETQFWSTVAIDGAMYAVRRELVQFPKGRAVPDDFVISMNAANQGYRMVYDREAVAIETGTPSNEEEFRRRIRIGAQITQAFLNGEGVPSISQFRLWWAYVSHKLLRSWLPVFLATALISSIALCFWNPLWMLTAVPQILFYCIAALGYLVPSFGAGAGRIPFYFTMVNVAILIGLLRGLANREKALGFKTSRQAMTRPPE